MLRQDTVVRAEMMIPKMPLAGDWLCVLLPVRMKSNQSWRVVYLRVGDGVHQKSFSLAILASLCRGEPLSVETPHQPPKPSRVDGLHWLQ